MIFNRLKAHTLRSTTGQVADRNRIILAVTGKLLSSQNDLHGGYIGTEERVPGNGSLGSDALYALSAKSTGYISQNLGRRMSALIPRGSTPLASGVSS